MKIAMLAPFEESVPPAKYGGTERVIHYLTEGLIQSGHDVTLLATGDSNTGATLKAIFPRALRLDPSNKDMRVRDANKFLGLGRVVEYLAEGSFDVVHSHLGWRILPFSKTIKPPMIHTLHGPLDVGYQRMLYELYPDASYVSISHNQRVPLPGLNYVANVYNGTNIQEFDFVAEPEDYFAFLGRMSPEKGPVQAVKLARRTGVKLRMAAKVDRVDEEFFKREVEPLIDGDQITFIGEVGHEEKNKLLGGARALLAPIQWEEPFGLYFIEALACGTPVITFNRGSAPEIIRDGKTGYLCATPRQMMDRIKEIDKIDRKICRDDVATRFSTGSMTAGYLDAYRSVLGG